MGMEKAGIENLDEVKQELRMRLHLEKLKLRMSLDFKRPEFKNGG